MKKEKNFNYKLFLENILKTMIKEKIETIERYLAAHLNNLVGGSKIIIPIEFVLDNKENTPFFREKLIESIKKTHPWLSVHYTSEQLAFTLSKSAIMSNEN